ncbi:glutathione peroxidase [Thalassospira profundimaris]|uniref:Glutathione peroxidase n=1 Tax=Thalassospira profundimaris TaxID=502049 RepID=A0A367XFV9_9PROT|nr:glutathione peroxidase [Thalassospira profundimaris]RCK52575.1 glutathione peroxidase [Thalassospira profundimaris]
MTSAHDFEFQSIDGDELPLKSFAGKVVLIVNTAPFCGFTPQYEGLESLWQKRQNEGLVVLGVPSGDFGGQEYKDNHEIADFCTTSFNIDFPMTTRQPVRGEGAHPFYKWARDELGLEQAPKWNFHKYLIGRDGQLLASFPSSVTPGDEKLQQAITDALSKKH